MPEMTGTGARVNSDRTTAIGAEDLVTEVKSGFDPVTETVRDFSKSVDEMT